MWSEIPSGRAPLPFFPDRTYPGSPQSFLYILSQFFSLLLSREVRSPGLPPFPGPPSVLPCHTYSKLSFPVGPFPVTTSHSTRVCPGTTGGSLLRRPPGVVSSRLTASLVGESIPSRRRPEGGTNSLGPLRKLTTFVKKKILCPELGQEVTGPISRRCVSDE